MKNQPKTPKSEKLSLRIPPEQLEALRRAASENGIKSSELIRRIIAASLDRQIDESDPMTILIDGVRRSIDAGMSPELIPDVAKAATIGYHPQRSYGRGKPKDPKSPSPSYEAGQSL